MISDKWDTLRVDIYEEISYHLGIDDSDDGACDAKNRAALGVLRLIERELAGTEAEYLAHGFAQQQHVQTWAEAAHWRSVAHEWAAERDEALARVEAAWEWISRVEPVPELNGDLLRGLRSALSGGAVS